MLAVPIHALFRGKNALGMGFTAFWFHCPPFIHLSSNFYSFHSHMYRLPHLPAAPKGKNLRNPKNTIDLGSTSPTRTSWEYQIPRFQPSIFTVTQCSHLKRRVTLNEFREENRPGLFLRIPVHVNVKKLQFTKCFIGNHRIMFFYTLGVKKTFLGMTQNLKIQKKRLI